LVGDEEAPQVSPADPPVSTRGAECEEDPPVDPLAHGRGIHLQKPADVVGGVELVHSALPPVSREIRTTSGSRTAVKRRERTAAVRSVPRSAGPPAGPPSQPGFHAAGLVNVDCSGPR